MYRFFFLLILNLITKGFCFIEPNESLDSDQAIVLIMGNRILQGIDFPIFFYGLRYLAPIELYITIPFFALFGLKYSVMLCVEILLSTMNSYLLFLLLRNKNIHWAMLSSVLFSIGNEYLNSLLVDISANYNLTLSFVLIGAFLLPKEKEDNIKKLFLVGLLIGLGLYMRELTVFYLGLLPILWFLSLTVKRNILVIPIGFFIGYLPAILFPIIVPYSNKLIKVIPKLETDFNKLIKVVPDILAKIYLPTDTNHYFTNLVLLIITFIGISIFYFSIYFSLTSKKSSINFYFNESLFYYLTIGTILNLSFVLITKEALVYRYYIGTMIFYTLGISGFLILLYEKKRTIFYFLFIVYVGLVLNSTYRTYKQRLDRLDSGIKSIKEVLIQENKTSGFSEYWANYPLTFLTNEKIYSMTYLDRQRDILGAIHVLENGVDFYLFIKDSNFEKNFLATHSLNDYSKIEKGKYSLYLCKKKEFPWGENTQSILEELKTFTKYGLKFN
ncbi:MAG: hypothetical protein SFU98_12505 [Leptospiraceae bacterium]|nr:hypothetical protein [Leptospiraceae bacterium]